MYHNHLSSSKLTHRLVRPCVLILPEMIPITPRTHYKMISMSSCGWGCRRARTNEGIAEVLSTGLQNEDRTIRIFGESCSESEPSGLGIVGQTNTKVY